MAEPQPLGLYVHWPYCAHICPYCDFNVYRVRRPALTWGIVALALCFLGALFWPADFSEAYLAAFLFWLGLTLGCMAILMLQYLSGGSWGIVILRMLEEDGAPWRDLTLENPIRAIREISHDTSCRRRVRLANGRELSAVEIQAEYLNRALRFAKRRGLPPLEQRALEMWEHVMTHLEDDPFKLRTKARDPQRVQWLKTHTDLSPRELEWLGDGWSSPVAALRPAQLLTRVQKVATHFGGADDPAQRAAAAVGFMTWPAA